MVRMHSLLKRQLRKSVGDSVPIPGAWQEFVDAVNNAYWESDADRNMLERSLDLSSRELLQANSEMRAVFQAFPDLFFRLDRDGTILEYKTGSVTDLYLPSEKLIGKKIHEVPFRDIGDKFIEAIHQMHETKSITTIEYEMRVQGQDNFYEARLLPLVEGQIFVIVRNTTERKRLEDELLKVKKLESIGTLAGGIAHDYNNLLSAVMGNLSLMQLYVDPESKAFQPMNGAMEACKRSKELTSKFLTFSGGGTPIKKRTNISGLLRSTAELTLSGSRMECEFSIQTDLWLVDADESQMGQVIHNLVINAREAMPDGGKIRIRAENIDVDSAGGAVLKEGHYIRISIQDHGVGICRRNLERIFDPYFSTKEAGVNKGMGLGLTIAHSIIRKHDGFIDVESERGVGTTVQVYLPASPGQTILKR